MGASHLSEVPSEDFSNYLLYPNFYALKNGMTVILEPSAWLGGFKERPGKQYVFIKLLLRLLLLFGFPSVCREQAPLGRLQVTR